MMTAKTALMAAGGALAVWAVATFCLWRWQEKLIFFPQPLPADTAGLADMQITVDAGGGVILRGWRHPGNAAAAPTDCRLLIYFGGNSEEVSPHLSTNGMRFACPQWYVNYRGFGQSGGTPTAAGLRADALQIFDQATRQHHIAADSICVMGRSLGSHMAALVAAERPVKKLIMVTPFDSVLGVAQQRYPIFPVRHLLRHTFDTLAEAGQVTAPTLFLLAETDRMVPAARSENLIAHWRSPHTVLRLPHTSHNNMESPAYWRAVSHFLSPDAYD